MNRSIIEKAVDECYEAELRGGKAALEACLSKYPEFRDEIAALVELALQYTRLPVDVKPSERFLRRTRERLLATARGEGPENGDEHGQQP